MAEDLIHLLPDSVANQIAAGEVIQRPASVVKELVENALDAGATIVQVRLTDAGRTHIQVIDNGKGMSETDARMAFERHATSKIKEASDLFALSTFGFRGEALPSIAAVAQVELRTRRQEDDLGTVIHIAGSKLEKQEVEMCPVGANFQIKNLFFNVPARRKFLKSNQTELNNVMTEMERIALVNPEVAFTLHHNDVELLNVPQSTLRQRIQSLFGKKLGQELLSIDVDTTLVGIKGYVGVPASARKKGAHCFFFVNGRYMRHAYFHKAIMEAYAHLIPPTEQVPYFLYFTVEPSRIDVNIHPTKTEIKFEDEQAIWQILMASVREVLGRSNMAPTIDFDVSDCPEIPVFTSGNTALPPPTLTVDANYNPFKQNNASDSYRRPATNWDILYGEGRGLSVGREVKSDVPFEDDLPWATASAASVRDRQSGNPLFASEVQEQSNCSVCYQYKGRYIVTSMKSGLLLVDQHRAHVCVLFEKYLKQLSDHPAVSQGMLFPEMIELPISHAVVMESLLDDFCHLGFDISHMGGGSFAIQGIPEGIAGLNPSSLVSDMLSEIMEKGNMPKEEVYRSLALTMSRAAALVVGEVLSAVEMGGLVDALFACEMPGYTPDGKKTFVVIDDSELERLFR